jgi:hypothetical protein
MFLSPEIKNWVFIPIMLVMILVGLLRHHATRLLNTIAKPESRQLRETSALFRCRNIRENGGLIPYQGFMIRKQYITEAFEAKKYLKVPDFEGKQANPMGDPSALSGTMKMMQKNMVMFIPQTLLMSWITFFFSGFVLTKLPFPLTVRFKEMLQRGIDTTDMDVTWVSSLSWYFLNLFGLTSVYTLLLGGDSDASGSMDMMAMQQMGQSNPMQQPAEVANVFKNEKEFMELAEHTFQFENIEETLLEKYGMITPNPKKLR